jgi:translation initiation factor eIF-2B subunit gamma
VDESVVTGELVSLKDSVVGAGCTIGTRSKLNQCILMEGAKVADGCVIQNSIICSNGSVEERCNINDSQVGVDAVVPAGAKYKKEYISSNAD